MSNVAKRAAMEKDVRELGRVLGSALDPGTGFALVLYDYGDGGDLAYVSSASRPDTVKLLRELARKLEGDA